jgi:hypothetical protein
MLNRSLIAVLMLVAVLVSPLISAADQAALPAVPAGVRLLQAGATSAVLELVTPSYTLQLDSDKAGHRLTVPGATTSADPGRPQLPIFSALISVPADARVEIRLQRTDSKPIPGRYTLTPAPQPASLSDDLQPGRMITQPDAETYASTAWYPAAPARIVDDGWLRHQRIVRIELSPFQYSPALGQLIRHRHLQIEVRWRQTGIARQHMTSDALDAALGSAVLNHDAALAWQRPLGERTTPRTRQRLASQAVPARYKIVVERDGMYQLTSADLQAAGMDLATVDPRMFRLTSQGQEVAIDVSGEQDGHFDSGDTIVFYGEQFKSTSVPDTVVLNGSVVTTDTQMSESYALPTSYTDANVYWLSADGKPGPRIAQVDGTPGSAPVPAFYRETVRAEQSNVWWTWHFTSRDIWFWERVQTGDTITRTYTTTLSAPATTPISATVSGEVVARSHNPNAAPDHRTRVQLNAAAVEDATWDGLIRHRFAAQIPQSALREGTNDLSFSVIKQPALVGDDLFFDWFAIEYARRFEAEHDRLAFTGADQGTWRYQLAGFSQPAVQVYNISTPTAPQRITNVTTTPLDGTYRLEFQTSHPAGARFVAVAAPALQRPAAITRYVPPDLSGHSFGADYIIITHRDLHAASERLANYRAGQGLRTVVVDVEDLYNQFNDGIYHPVAIKRFLAYAYAHWQAPAPAYVVLVGDGHWNFKNHNPQRYGGSPILMPPNMAWVDPWQGEVDSTNLLAAIVGTDLLPDLAIGRLPVNSTAELNTIIDKTIAYEQTPVDEWQQRLLFVADNTPDDAGDFVTLSEALIDSYAPPDAAIDRLYLTDLCGSPSGVPAPCPAATNRLIDTLNVSGTLLLSYIGHASIGRWAHEQLLTNAHIPALTNRDRLPVVLSMTCLDGYWFYPNQPGLTEDLVRAPNGGAIATFSPTGLGVATGHDVLERAFYQAVFHNHVRRLGPATLAAKQALYATGSHADLLNTFVILGDPALRLALPPFNLYSPIATGGS